MTKHSLAAVAALVIAGSTLSHAQDRAPDPGRPPHPVISQEDRKAFLDARIAALKAGLELTPAQEPNWPAYEQAIRNISKLHSETEAERAQATPPSDPIERLQRRGDALSKRGAALKQLAEAAAPLYGSLDEAQKRRFMILVQHLHPHRHHHGMGMGGEFDHERGFDARHEFGGWRHDHGMGGEFEHEREFDAPHEGGGWRHEPGQ